MDSPQRQGWRSLLVAYGITSTIESLGVSQIFALLPARLLELGVTGDARLTFIGIFSSLIFVVGAPLVPLWGVWADKYSRRAVIVRSAVVEAVVFAGVAIAQTTEEVISKRRATMTAVAAANYVAKRLNEHFPVLYAGAGGFVAHECILDLRELTGATGVSVDDVAKRLIDYGFHAPTMSFPVAGTLMVEPTESEDLRELDRFCDAMIAIRHEIDDVASGRWAVEDSPLRGAPHTAQSLAGGWEHPYTRVEAAYPAGVEPTSKYWPPVRRIDGAYGDRHLVCSCPPPEAFAD